MNPLRDEDSLVFNLMERSGCAPMKNLCLQFGETGTTDDLREEFRFGTAEIYRPARSLVHVYLS